MWGVFYFIVIVGLRKVFCVNFFEDCGCTEKLIVKHYFKFLCDIESIFELWCPAVFDGFVDDLLAFILCLFELRSLGKIIGHINKDKGK